MSTFFFCCLLHELWGYGYPSVFHPLHLQVQKSGVREASGCGEAQNPQGTRIAALNLQRK